MTTRTRRMTVLAQLLGGRRFSNQEELARALARAGETVTQATLSRDLRSLGVGKRPGPDGRPIYELQGPPAEQLDRERQLLDLRSFVNEVRVAQNLVVVRTPPGHAHGVGRAIDLGGFEDVIGSVAGDDTVLIVTPDGGRARRIKRRLDELAQRSAAGSGK